MWLLGEDLEEQVAVDLLMTKILSNLGVDQQDDPDS